MQGQCVWLAIVGWALYCDWLQLLSGNVQNRLNVLRNLWILMALLTGMCYLLHFFLTPSYITSLIPIGSHTANNGTSYYVRNIMVALLWSPEQTTVR